MRQFLTADEVADLQTKMGSSLIQVARSDDAEVLMRMAIEHWRSVGNDRREAESLLMLSGSAAALGHTERSMTHLTDAVAILEGYGRSPELAHAYIRLTSAHMLARDRDTAVEWGERAIALSTREGDAGLLARALIETGIADVMDGRIEGLTVVRRGIALARDNDLPGPLVGGLSQIGSGCGEMRNYAEAVPALVEGSAVAAEHNLEANRRYQVAWLARCQFDLGQWDDAERSCSRRDRRISQCCDCALRRPQHAGMVGCTPRRFRCVPAARRGNGDGSRDATPATPVAERCRASRGRLARGCVWIRTLRICEEVFELALRCRHGIAIGEIGVWLQRAGAPLESAGGCVRAVRLVDRRRSHGCDGRIPADGMSIRSGVRSGGDRRGVVAARCTRHLPETRCAPDGPTGRSDASRTRRTCLLGAVDQAR